MGMSFKFGFIDERKGYGLNVKFIDASAAIFTDVPRMILSNILSSVIQRSSFSFGKRS